MPLPTCSTSRLQLRGIQPGDEPILVELDTDLEVMQHIHLGPLSPDEAQKWAELQVQGAMLQRHLGRWIITLRDDNSTPIGWVELAKYHGTPIDETGNDYFAFGYQMSPAYWGNGYMREAASAALDYAFEFGLKKVLAYARPENVRSIRLIERLGFVRIGERLDEARKMCNLYQLTREEWPGA